MPHTSVAAAPEAKPAVVDEIPLEILDYSCTNIFEEAVKEVEKFLLDAFQTRSELAGFLYTPASTTASTASTPSGSSSSSALISSSSLLSFPSDTFSANGKGVAPERAGPMSSGASPSQRQTVGSAPPLTGPVIIGSNFPLGRRQGTEPVLCVEIHVWDYQHPVGRQFCLPLFLLIKSTTQQSAYNDTESAYYLSILATAAGNVFGAELALDIGGHPLAGTFSPAAFAGGIHDGEVGPASPLPSPHRIQPNGVPCFAPIGDLFKQTFTGCSPPLARPGPGTRLAGQGTALTQEVSSWALWSQTTFSAHLRSSAYGQAPAGCQYLSDFLDLFQLHIGQRSRVRSEEFGGMSVSLWKRFSLTIPWRFRLHNAASGTSGVTPAFDSMTTRNSTISWSEALDQENEALLVLCGPQTHPFGTSTVPLESVLFDFQWNQLRDVEAHENASRTYLDPFALSSTPSGKEVNRKCSIVARGVVHREDDLRHTATRHVRSFVDLLLERAGSQAEWENVSAPIPVSQRTFSTGQSSLEAHVNTILTSSLQAASAQEALLNKLRSQDDGVVAGLSANNPARLQEHLAQLLDGVRAGSSPRGARAKVRPKAGEADRFRDLRRAYFPGSLLSRIAYLCVEEELHNRLTAEDVYVLWQHCISALKRRVEHRGNEGVASALDCLGLPVCDPAVDISQPILVQKLQMLAHCLRVMLLQSPSGGGSCPRNPTDGWDESSDSLSGADMENEASPPKGPWAGTLSEGRTQPTASTLDGNVDSASSTPSSRRRQLRLITNGEPLVVPPSLPRPPVTSDVLLQRARKMNELGTSAIAQATRAWLQSDSLYNDMCLFQYVNQVQSGRVVRFADFIQWHSPRDFHLPPGGAPSPNDNDYLSPRMQSGEDGSTTQVWASLWKRAVPRSREQIIADGFRPAEEAALVFRWIEEMAEATLLLEVANASIANALHRLLCHRAVIAPFPGSPVNRPRVGQWTVGGDQNDGASSVVPAVRAYVKQRCASLTASLEAASALFVGLPQGAPFSMELEGVASMYAMALRETDEIETLISVVVALECLLGKANLAVPEGAEIIRGLGCPNSAQSDPSRLELTSQPIPLPAWVTLIAGRFVDPESRTPRQMRARLTCMAERPLGTSECFQQLTVERFDTGVFRMALILTQEAA